MMSKLEKINNWYDTLVHINPLLRFFIFLLIMVAIFYVSPVLKILALITLIIFRIVTGYAQNYTQKNKIQKGTI